MCWNHIPDKIVFISRGLQSKFIVKSLYTNMATWQSKKKVFASQLHPPSQTNANSLFVVLLIHFSNNSQKNHFSNSSFARSVKIGYLVLLRVYLECDFFFIFLYFPVKLSWFMRNFCTVKILCSKQALKLLIAITTLKVDWYI